MFLISLDTFGTVAQCRSMADHGAVATMSLRHFWESDEVPEIQLAGHGHDIPPLLNMLEICFL